MEHLQFVLELPAVWVLTGLYLLIVFVFAALKKNWPFLLLSLMTLTGSVLLAIGIFKIAEGNYWGFLPVLAVIAVILAMMYFSSRSNTT